MLRFSLLAASLLIAGCAPAAAPALSSASDPAPPAAGDGATRILDRAAADRLLEAKGVTLQWIGWDQRGPVSVREEGGTITLSGAQHQPDGPGRLSLSGRVVEIGADYFTFQGTIRITDTPDPGRMCEGDKQWHFAITQNRPYWRLREFEWCDGLTDYIDIYL